MFFHFITKHSELHIQSSVFAGGFDVLVFHPFLLIDESEQIADT